MRKVLTASGARVDRRREFSRVFCGDAEVDCGGIRKVIAGREAIQKAGRPIPGQWTMKGQ